MIKQAYINGFMCKCAERGIDNDTANALVKRALSASSLGAIAGGVLSGPALAISGLGASIGAIIDRKKRLRGALIGALLGIPSTGIAAGAVVGDKLGRAYSRLISQFPELLPKE